jgi:hypothetical protein
VYKSSLLTFQQDKGQKATLLKIPIASRVTFKRIPEVDSLKK